MPPTLAQTPENSTVSDLEAERLAELSSWFDALDGFLADTTANAALEVDSRAWKHWLPASKLASLASSESAVEGQESKVMPPPEILQSTVPEDHSNYPADPVQVFTSVAAQALNELAMIASGIPSPDDGVINVLQLPVFVAASESLLDLHPADPLEHSTLLFGGANPLRVFLAFLSSLNTRDREAFRLLVGIGNDSVFNLLDFSGFQVPVQDGSESDGPGSVQASGSSVDISSNFSKVVDARPMSGGLVEAEKLLGLWRSNRLRLSRLQPGGITRSEAKPEAGKYLAELLDTVYGPVIFKSGWAGERFAQDAKRDLSEAWSSIGRAVAVDMRREAAPWLARRLGTSAAPAFSLEYTVRASPSNAFKALMTMRVNVAGVSYGIPYQVVSRALNAASAAYFGEATIPVRYVEEPHPGLRIYVALDDSDNGKAVSELEADLSAAYPLALRVPSILLAVPPQDGILHEEVCIALDGAYREASVGVVLARSFTSLLHSRGYPEMASLIFLDADVDEDVGASDDGGTDSRINQDVNKTGTAGYTEGGNE